MISGSTTWRRLSRRSDVVVPTRPSVGLSSSRPDTVGIGGTMGSTQSREAIEMAHSVDIHCVPFITGSAKDQSESG